jgi:hypothetical protein
MIPSCARCRSWRIRAEWWVRGQPRDPGHTGFDLDPRGRRRIRACSVRLGSSRARIYRTRWYGAEGHRNLRDHPKVGWLRRAAVVAVQDAAETLATRNRRSSRIGALVGRHGDRRDQPIVETLVVALAVVVLDELRDREAKVALTEGNELAQALGLDREHEAFRKRV